MGLEKGFEGRPGKPELETCPNCKGSGVVTDKSGKKFTCTKCNGRGKLQSARLR
jgi:DnaJ-class molecular chaperone